MPGHTVFQRAIPALLSGLAVLMGGCATPFLQSGVEVPGQFAATPASETAPEVAWWEGFGDPVLSDLIQRAARENRDVQNRGGARARRASRRDDPPFLAVADLRCQCLWRQQRFGWWPRPQDRIGRAQRVVGDRCRRRASRRRVRGNLREDRNRRRRARRPAAGTDGRRDELLHAGRRPATARDGSRDLGGTGRDAASRHRATARGPCFHVRRRARADGRVERAGGDTAARNAGRRLAAPNRRADRRPGIECHGRRRPVERHRGRSGRADRAAGDAPRAPAGPACLPRAARGGQLEASRGGGGVVPAPLRQRLVRPARTSK